MTTIVVLADPPVAGHVLEELTPDPLSESEARDLYAAMLTDVCETIQRGDASLLVNYRPADQLDLSVDSESQLRDLLDEELDESPRYEPQVGETYSGRVGNALTHLLETEEVPTVAVIDPTAVFLRRDTIGTLFMKLRASDVVLAPSLGGRVAVAAFGEPVDFADAFAPPAIETLTSRALAADLDVEFLDVMPVVESPEDLATAVALASARRDAGRIVPPRTTARLEAFGLTVAEDGTVTRVGAD